jgi:hypothetical protein
MEKHKKLSAPRLKSIPFLLLWMGGHILVWSLLYWMFETDITRDLPEAVWTVVCGVVMGLGLAFMQKFLIQYTYYAPLNGWLCVTIAGWIVGWVIFYFSIEFIEDYISSYNNNLSIMLLPLFVIPAVMQWFIMRHNARQAWLWIVVGAASAMAFGALYGEINNNEYMQFLLGAAAQGAVTGLSLLWLYGQARAEKVKTGTS